MTQSSCPGLDVVKGSVEEALARSINATLSLLTDLSSHAEEYEASCVSGPSILTALYVKFQLCNMLSVLDEFLPITDSNLKFISTAYKFKSVISKISTSTRQKIPNHDFDGVLSDLKNFTRENPLVAAELRSLLQEVFTALTSLLKRTKSTAESFSLGTTSHEATVTLFNDLREISEKSNMFATYLADDHFDEYAKMKDLDKGINATMNLICGDCLSRMDDLKVTLGKSKFYEIEDLLAATARTLPILERLSRDIEVANQVRWSVSSKKMDKQPRPEDDSPHSVKAFIRQAEQLADMLKCKSDLIGSALSDISSYYCKPTSIDQVRALPPIKLFDDLERAERFGVRYSTAAKSLHEYLYEDVMTTLRSIQSYIDYDNSSMEMNIEHDDSLQQLKVPQCPSDTNMDEATPSAMLRKPLGLTASPISCLEECEELVRGVQLFTPFFPLKLYEQYQSNLEETKTMVEKVRRTHDLRICEANNIDAGDCQRSIDLFFRYVRNGDFNRMKDIGDKLNTQSDILIRKIILDLNAGKLLSVLSVSMPLHHRWVHYVYQLQHWKQYPIYYSCYLNSSRFSRNPVIFDVNPSIKLMHELLQSFVAATNNIIDRQKDFTLMQVPEMEPLFDGLSALLQSEGDFVRGRIFNSDESLRARASGAILSIAGRFAVLGQKISSWTTQICSIMSSTGGQKKANAEELSNSISMASKLLIVAKKSAPLFRKVESLLDDRKLLLTMQQLESLRVMELPSSDDMNANINAAMEATRKVARPSLLDNQLLITPNASDRNFFYCKVQVALTLLIQWDADQAIINGCVNNRANEESCRDKLCSEIESIGCAADRLVDTTDYERFGVLYDNLRSISENLSDNILQDRAVGRMKTIDGIFFQRIEVMKCKGWLNEAEWNSNPFGDHFYERVANELINMKSATTHVARYKQHVDEKFIDVLLADYKARPTGASGTSFFLGLSIYLGGIRTSDAPIVSQILSEHIAFSGHKLLLRNERILRLTVEDMLHDISGDDETSCGQQLSSATKESLLQISASFEEEYWALVEAGLERNKFLSVELQSIVNKTKVISQRSDLPPKLKIRSLMAHIFAYWTLSESEHFQQSQARDHKLQKESSAVRRNTALLQPHSGQIVGILRLFGLDEDSPGTPSQSEPKSLLIPSMKDKDHASFNGKRPGKTVKRMKWPKHKRRFRRELNFELENHLVEIGTGEGKSVTLAVSAMLLALLGFEVDVVCYSEYLTNRDSDAFEDLISVFGLSDFIKYGTFLAMAERSLGQRGSIWGLVSAALNGTAYHFEEYSNATKRVLLVDEVDVFFDKRIYFSSYRPSQNVYGAEVTAFIKELWAVYKRGDKNALSKVNVTQWPVYVACIQRYVGWEFVIERSVSRLIQALTTFEDPTHEYHVDCARNRIGYKVFDGISYTTSYGAWTMFAYFKEHENGKITAEGLEMKIKIDVLCGSYSYAAMPKLYDNILGVSGTLKELSEKQRSVLRDEYEVKNTTYLRSVYGNNKLVFDGNSASAIKITDTTEYYKEIVNEIHLQLIGKIKNRAVFVFLKTKKEVNDFLASPPMNALRGQVRVIREEDTAADREVAVRQAVTSKSITVMSCDFGRGTDFICFDDDLDASGGVHVIQTFVSLEVSEERQIKGRTARQGNQGSYSMVLLDSELKDIGISKNMIKKIKDSGHRYAEIDRLRRQVCDDNFEKKFASLSTLNQKHEDSMIFLEALRNNDIPSIKESMKKFS